jgi:hypothetical protein
LLLTFYPTGGDLTWFRGAIRDNLSVAMTIYEAGIHEERSLLHQPAFNLHQACIRSWIYAVRQAKLKLARAQFRQGECAGWHQKFAGDGT